MKRQRPKKLPSFRYKKLGLIIACLLVGGIGVWLTFATFASDFHSGSGANMEEADDRPLYILFKGASYTNDSGVNSTRNNAPIDIVIRTVYNSALVEKPTVTCATGVTCINVTYSGSRNITNKSIQGNYSSWASTAKDGPIFCVPKVSEAAHWYKFDTTYKIIANSVQPNSIGSSDSTLGYRTIGVLPAGTCKKNFDVKGIAWGYSDVVCDADGTAKCYTTPSKATNPKVNSRGSGGEGSGPGTSGSGSGKKGTGSGGGGSSATKQNNQSNPVVTPSPQGATEQEPTMQEPSPFFDGKQYSVGSDPDAQTPGDLVKHPGKMLVNWWFYPIAAVVLAGLSVGGWFGWKYLKKRRGAKQ